MKRLLALFLTLSLFGCETKEHYVRTHHCKLVKQNESFTDFSVITGRVTRFPAWGEYQCDGVDVPIWANLPEGKR